MVKELDLFESNHGCWLNALSREDIRNGRNTTLHGPELARNVFPKPFGAGRAITHGFSTFEYFDLTRFPPRQMYVSSTLPEPLGGFNSRRYLLFGSGALLPAPNGGVVRREPSFLEQFLDVSIGKREPQIPTNGANNNLGFKVPPYEQFRPGFDHGIHCSLSDPFSQFLQHCPYLRARRSGECT